MPITFEQPQPVSSQISAAYGSTEQLSRDLPAIASIYQRNAAMQQAAAEHAQALAAQQNIAQAGIGERRLEMQQHGMDQAAQFATSRLPSERDAFLAQSELAQQDRRAQNAAWLNQQQLSQQEQMDLQKMKESVGYVQNNPNLTDDEKENFITRLRTKIDPMEMRLKQQQVEHQQKQDQLIDGQLRKQAEHEETNRQFQAQMMKEGKAVVTWVDDNGRRHPLIKNEKTGEWYNPLQSSHEVTARLQAAQEEKRVAAETKVVADAETAYERLEKEARAEFHKRQTAKNPDNNLKEPNLSGEGESDRKYQSDTLKGMINDATGTTSANPRQEYRDRKLAQHREITGGVGRQGGSVAAPDGGGGGADFGPKSPTIPEADTKPFTLDKLADATPMQRQSVENIYGLQTAAMRADPAQVKRWTDEGRWAMGVLAQYGHTAKMPPEVQDHLLKVIKELERGGQGPKPAPPPARGLFPGIEGTPAGQPMRRVF